MRKLPETSILLIIFPIMIIAMIIFLISFLPDITQPITGKVIVLAVFMAFLCMVFSVFFYDYIEMYHAILKHKRFKVDVWRQSGDIGWRANYTVYAKTERDARVKVLRKTKKEHIYPIQVTEIQCT